MIFKRKIYDELLKWKKESNGKTAVLIEGQRRVGKSTIVKEFAKNEYKSFILINFSNVNPDIISNFQNNSFDLNTFFANLSFFYKTILYERNSLIIFDEVQLFPRARELIKFFVEDGRYDFIETGSLISLYKSTKNIIIPSEEERLILNPMDFEEFLRAFNDTFTISYLKGILENRKSISDAQHRQLLLRYYQYISIGGMPQAVKEYVETSSYQLADSIKRNIIKLYTDDIEKYSIPRSRENIKTIYGSIPSQLMHHTTFNARTSVKGKKISSLSKELDFLEKSKIVNFCYRIADPSVGLSYTYESSKFKIYSSDTGLMITQILMNNKTTGDEIYKKLITGKLGLNEGMILENAVSQALTANSDKLFYTTFSKDNSKKYFEVDFLIARGNKITPIEVKSSSYLSHKSFDEFCKKYSQLIGKKYIITTKNLKFEGDLIYLPIYMISLI